MKAIKEFVKTTVVGGIVFLVPLILLILVLRHAMAFAGKIAGPVAEAFPAHKFAGIAVATIIAAFVLLLLSFLAGLFARTGFGRDLARWLEDSLLGNLPQYQDQQDQRHQEDDAADDRRLDELFDRFHRLPPGYPTTST